MTGGPMKSLHQHTKDSHPDSVVREIVLAPKSESTRALAARLGVSPSYVQRTRRAGTWRAVNMKLALEKEGLI